MSDIDIETEQTRAEIAAYFRNFADELDRDGAGGRDVTNEVRGTETRGNHQSTGTTTDTGPGDTNTDSSPTGDSRSTGARSTDDETRGVGGDDSVTIIIGNESATINPPDTMRFQIEVESDSSMLSPGEDRMARFTLTWAGEEVPPNDDIRIE